MNDRGKLSVETIHAISNAGATALNKDVWTRRFEQAVCAAVPQVKATVVKGWLAVSTGPQLIEGLRSQKLAALETLRRTVQRIYRSRQQVQVQIAPLQERVVHLLRATVISEIKAFEAVRARWSVSPNLRHREPDDLRNFEDEFASLLQQTAAFWPDNRMSPSLCCRLLTAPVLRPNSTSDPARSIDLPRSM